jgi:hypothetical protein
MSTIDDWQRQEEQQVSDLPTSLARWSTDESTSTPDSVILAASSRPARERRAERSAVATRVTDGRNAHDMR